MVCTLFRLEIGHTEKESNNTNRTQDGEKPSQKPNSRPFRRKLEKTRAKVRMGRPKIEDPSAEAFKNMQDDVRLGLISCEPGKELEILHQTLRPIHNALWFKCMEVKKDIWTALQRFYPGVRLQVFGSTVMGIAFKGKTN